MIDSNIKEHSPVLLTLYDKDVFPDKPEIPNVTWKDRPTSKVVLLNEKQEIALVSNKITNLFLLPGGGIEEGEDFIAGAKRECKEETGYEIEILQDLGVTEDFRARDGRHCVSHGYLAKALSRGDTSLSESEADIGFFLEWRSLAEAVQLFAAQEEKVKRGDVEFYNTCFNIIRDSFFIRQAQSRMNQE